jgi:hypothetical protein
MPLMNLPRCMTVVRLSDSRLVVSSAIALDEKEMCALDALPNDTHRLDAKVWRECYQRCRWSLSREGQQASACRYDGAELR